MSRTRVKICCVASLEEARLAVVAGADAIGLVGRMPSGPGPIEDALIAAIAPTVPPSVATFLLTSETEPAAIAAHVRRCRTGTVQIVERVAIGAYAGLRAALPAVRLVQVVHVTSPEALDHAAEAGPHADALLLDSGQPDAAVRVLGGTGQTHDWRISRRIVDEAPCPVFLAGGLKAENVSQAIDEVRPFGLDVCTGVRIDGRLDAARLEAFMAAVRRADEARAQASA